MGEVDKGVDGGLGLWLEAPRGCRRCAYGGSTGTGSTRWTRRAGFTLEKKRWRGGCTGVHSMGCAVGRCDAALTFSPLGPAGPGGPMGPVRPYRRETDEDVVSVSILCQPTPRPCPTYTCAILARSSFGSFLTNISLWDGMSVSRAET